MTRKHTPDPAKREAGLQGVDLRVEVGGRHMPEQTQENNSLLFLLPNASF